MSENTTKTVTDLLGIAPIGRTVEKASDALVQAISSLLGRVCLPAAEEYGFYWKDKISNWRKVQALEFTKKAEHQLKANSVSENDHANPRIVHQIFEQASWTDDATVQDLWAGLLASSCTEDGSDESNLIFCDLLSRLTKMQAKILNFACKECTKYMFGDLIQAGPFVVKMSKLEEVTSETDLLRFDRELDFLVSLDLFENHGGLQTSYPGIVDLTPTALALHMIIRTTGSRLHPKDFYATSIKQGTITHPAQLKFLYQNKLDEE